MLCFRRRDVLRSAYLYPPSSSFTACLGPLKCGREVKRSQIPPISPGKKPRYSKKSLSAFFRKWVGVQNSECRAIVHLNCVAHDGPQTQGALQPGSFADGGTLVQQVFIRAMDGAVFRSSALETRDSECLRCESISFCCS